MYVEVLLARKSTVDTIHPQHYDNAIVHWLVHFRVPQAVPLVGSTTYTQAAHACAVDEPTLRRIVRYAMLENIFYEADANSIAHTPFSSILVTDPVLRSIVEAETEESFPASAKLVEAYEKWSASEEPKHSAWCLANRSDVPVWEFLREPEREERANHYNKLMNVEDSAHDLRHTIEGYYWKSAKGTIVDIGGGTGQAAMLHSPKPIRSSRRSSWKISKVRSRRAKLLSHQISATGSSSPPTTSSIAIPKR